MSYNLSGLTKKSEGQIVRGGALKAKSDLEFKLTGLEREKAGLSGTAGSIAVELQSAELKAQLQQNYVSQLSDPEILAEEQFNLESLQFTVKKLKERIRTKGPIAVLELEIDIDHLQYRIADYGQLIKDLDALIPSLAD
jgi:hypothetical protein